MKFLFFICLLGISVNTFSQYEKSKIVIINFGKPSFEDVTDDSKGLSAGLKYHNRFSRSFAYECFILSARNNSLPSFYENDDKLMSYLYSLSLFEIIEKSWIWSDVSTLTMGAKIHHSFVNNQKWYFSISLGSGLYVSKSSMFSLHSIETLGPENTITSVEYSTPSAKTKSLFLMPGLTADYNIFKNFIVGIELTYMAPMNRGETELLPVYPNFFNASILLGIRL